jgi:phosphatidylserine decarboxylase
MSAPIEFFNRYTKRIETEQVYGDSFLRWAYHTQPGRATLAALVKRPAFSRFYGWLMDSSRSAGKIAPFIKKFGVDAGEFAQPPESFSSFNEFFFRRLKPEARPVDPDSDAAVFPADGRHLGFADVSTVGQVFVKNQRFDLAALLGDPSLAAEYARGSLVLSRLCPVDYHRFHFPVCGVPSPPRLIPGPLFSVSPVALRQRLSYLWENQRCVTELRTVQFGRAILIEIGATNVGSIVQTFRPGRPVAKGDEKGFFRFGGSSIITVFEPGRVRLADDLLEQSSQGRELYARVGDFMGARETAPPVRR